jgi:hypothetical protein
LVPPLLLFGVGGLLLVCCELRNGIFGFSSAVDLLLEGIFFRLLS